MTFGDGTDSDVLAGAGAREAKTVIAATGDDDANLLVSQLAKSRFDVDTVIARANNPDNVEPFEELGVRAISSSNATTWAIDNVVERPALSNWMTELGRNGDVQEIEVSAEDLVGTRITDLDGELPNGVLIALVGRNDDTYVLDGDFTLSATIASPSWARRMRSMRRSSVPTPTTDPPTPPPTADQAGFPVVRVVRGGGWAVHCRGYDGGRASRSEGGTTCVQRRSLPVTRERSPGASRRDLAAHRLDATASVHAVGQDSYPERGKPSCAM